MRKVFIPRGGAIKLQKNQLFNSGLSDIFLFFNSIRTFNMMVANTYASIKANDRNKYIFMPYAVRLMIDAIYNLYGLKLADNKLQYIKHFLEGKEINKIRVNGNNLTTNFIGEQISKEYEGLNTLYKESCRYIHPSIFYKINKKLLTPDNRGILTERNRWGIMGERNNRLKIDYIMDVLTDILTDLQIEIHNEILVNLYPDKLTPIKRKKRGSDLTKEGCMEFIRKHRPKKVKQQEIS